MCACVCCSLVSSLLSPRTSNVVKQAFKLFDLHKEAPGSSSACTKLLGPQVGTRLDVWMCKYLVWLLSQGVLAIIIRRIWPGKQFWPSLVFSICLLVPSVLTALCLNVSVVKSLMKVAGVWYFIISVVGGATSHYLIYEPRFRLVDDTEDAVGQALWACGSVAQTLGLIVGCAFLDAIPPLIFPRRARVCFLSLITVYKSAACF